MLRTFRSLLRFQRIVRTLARHDALAPLEEIAVAPGLVWLARRFSRRAAVGRPGEKLARALTEMGPSFIKLGQRSEEHTSELQSLMRISYAVFCLKKKKKKKRQQRTNKNE